MRMHACHRHGRNMQNTNAAHAVATMHCPSQACSLPSRRAASPGVKGMRLVGASTRAVKSTRPSEAPGPRMIVKLPSGVTCSLRIRGRAADGVGRRGGGAGAQGAPGNAGGNWAAGAHAAFCCRHRCRWKRGKQHSRALGRVVGGGEGERIGTGLVDVLPVPDRGGQQEGVGGGRHRQASRQLSTRPAVFTGPAGQGAAGWRVAQVCRLLPCFRTCTARPSRPPGALRGQRWAG